MLQIHVNNFRNPMCSFLSREYQQQKNIFSTLFPKEIKFLCIRYGRSNEGIWRQFLEAKSKTVDIIVFLSRSSVFLFSSKYSLNMPTISNEDQIKMTITNDCNGALTRVATVSESFFRWGQLVTSLFFVLLDQFLSIFWRYMFGFWELHTVKKLSHLWQTEVSCWHHH